ncbi:hypothetical protein [Stackebrandtia soli]|uniref:hypothetical protein n=1 Tax=Stackebrandtia soli TaxID=1892856 RepID=UPI0039E7BF66
MMDLSQDQRLALLMLLTDEHVADYVIALVFDDDDETANYVLLDLQALGLAEPVPDDVEAWRLTDNGWTAVIAVATDGADRAVYDRPVIQAMHLMVSALASAHGDELRPALTRMYAERLAVQDAEIEAIIAAQIIRPDDSN